MEMNRFPAKKTLGTLLLGLMIVAFTAPPALARNDRRCGGGSCYERHHGPRVHHHHHYKRSRVRGGDVAAGIIGGVVGLVVLDRLLNDRSPAYRAPAPPPAYDRGYSRGYREGYHHAQRDLYESGRQRGYYDGYRAGNY